MSREDNSFWNTIEHKGKTYWFFSSYVTKGEAERKAFDLRKQGFNVKIIRKPGVDGVYTYPQKRWGLN